MRTIVLQGETDWAGWRQATRRLVLAGIEPGALTWASAGTMDPLPDIGGTFHLPRALVDLAALAFQARDAERFGLLYTLVWRTHAGESPMRDPSDPDFALVRRMALSVRADAHRMRTHLRFLPVPDGSRLLGYYAPAHFVLEANAQLLARRFPALTWSIVTPDGSAHWDHSHLTFGSGLRHAAHDETLLAWWDAHGCGVQETATEGTSVPEAEALEEAPRPPDRPPIGPIILPHAAGQALPQAGRDIQSCQRCALFGPATQPVFGEGPADARVIFVGEQAGDQEDVIGRPFVGPAGQMMDRAMEEAGLDRRIVYVTNTVKHFKFVERGRRRIHQTPEAAEIQACAFWLDLERAAVRPDLMVLMGGTAARAVLGRPVTIGRERGRPIRTPDGQAVFVTVHPSFLLRLPDAESKAREYAAFVNDLRAIRGLMEGG